MVYMIDNYVWFTSRGNELKKKVVIGRCRNAQNLRNLRNFSWKSNMADIKSMNRSGSWAFLFCFVLFCFVLFWQTSQFWSKIQKTCCLWVTEQNFNKGYLGPCFSIPLEIWECLSGALHVPSMGRSTCALKPDPRDLRSRSMGSMWGSIQHAVNDHVRSESRLQLAHVEAKWPTEIRTGPGGPVWERPYNIASLRGVWAKPLAGVYRVELSEAMNRVLGLWMACKEPFFISPSYKFIYSFHSPFSHSSFPYFHLPGFCFLSRIFPSCLPYSYDLFLNSFHFFPFLTSSFNPFLPFLSSIISLFLTGFRFPSFLISSFLLLRQYSLLSLLYFPSISYSALASHLSFSSAFSSLHSPFYSISSSQLPSMFLIFFSFHPFFTFFLCLLFHFSWSFYLLFLFSPFFHLPFPYFFLSFPFSSFLFPFPSFSFLFSFFPLLFPFPFPIFLCFYFLLPFLRFLLSSPLID